ncbi:hypothetical protein KIN20_019270 [Parelaphostrongylus tenuis]|uniref:Uncharacterized protein n=1 Tax=Parelaphostrongylus tenuis TaxID=148309 RepID=A0AAD5N4M9_PARTN|nr:hypothetical protein KIN20_019270 [Parelaphostrongylus tenuis]
MKKVLETNRARPREADRQAVLETIEENPSLTSRMSVPHSGRPGREQLLSVLLSFVEQHAIPVFEVEKVNESALFPTPAIEVAEYVHLPLADAYFIVSLSKAWRS